jgi:hypothetical protein
VASIGPCFMPLLLCHACVALLFVCTCCAATAAAVFAYPGGASMEIHQALTRSETISNILCRHEQVRGGVSGLGYWRVAASASGQQRLSAAAHNTLHGRDDKGCV